MRMPRRILLAILAASLLVEGETFATSLNVHGLRTCGPIPCPLLSRGRFMPGSESDGRRAGRAEAGRGAGAKSLKAEWLSTEGKVTVAAPKTREAHHPLLWAGP